MNYIPTNIEGMGGIDAGTLFIETWGGGRVGDGGSNGIDGGSAFISTEGWNGTREGTRD